MYHLVNCATKSATTEGAVIQHSSRAWLQFSDWKNLESQSLDPLQNGWEINKHTSKFQPIASLDPIAPEELLKMTVCNCKSFFKLQGK